MVNPAGLSTGERAGRVSSRRLRWGTVTGTAAAALCFVMVSAGLAGAVHVVTMTAPYSGVVTGTFKTVSSSGCGKASLPTAPGFSGTSGTGQLGDAASAPTCTNPAGSSGYAYSGFTAQVPIAMHGTSATVGAIISENAVAKTNVLAATCKHTTTSYSYCYQYTTVYLAGYAYVEDTTNNSYFYASNYWAGVAGTSYVDDFCYSGNCSTFVAPNTTTSGTAFFSLFINVSAVNSHHHYILVLVFYGVAEAYEFTYGASATGGHARASLNVGGTHLIDLASITIV